MSCVGKELVDGAAKVPIVDVVEDHGLVTGAAILQVGVVLLSNCEIYTIYHKFAIGLIPLLCVYAEFFVCLFFLCLSLFFPVYHSACLSTCLCMVDGIFCYG